MLNELLERKPVRCMLAAYEKRQGYPRPEDAAWRDLSEEKKSVLRAWGDRAVKAGYPQLTATQFLAFNRTGDRGVFEKPYFTRRERLIGASLSECVEHHPAVLDTVVDGVWLLCEETFWGVSAHNGSAHPGAAPSCERVLPDHLNPYIDLFAAQTGCTLALIVRLLGDRLDEVSPLIVRRITDELERRIFTPFFYHDDFWWMGMTRQDLCNWTPWILSSILRAAQAVMRDDLRLAELITRACRMLDRYLDCVPEDGGCDEGPGYWNMAGGALLDCLEALREMTDGEMDFYDDPKIRKIGLFPLASHIAGDWFWNFADCDAKPMLDGCRLYVYGQRIGNPALSALGRVMQKSLVPRDTPQMNRVLDALLTDMTAEAPCRPEASVSLPCLQVWARRRGALYTVVKGGHNGENHNHNDVGQFMVYCDGEPVFIDAGNITYTAATFSDSRYSLWNVRSMNHSVPMIGESEQAAGRAYAAKDVQADEDSVSMDIASAYPKESGLISLRRRWTFGETLVLTDTARLSQPQTMTWVFMTREAPEKASRGLRIGPLLMTCPPALTFACEEIIITDPRMTRSFSGSLYRVTLQSPRALRHDAVFTITKESDQDDL